MGEHIEVAQRCGLVPAVLSECGPEHVDAVLRVLVEVGLHPVEFAMGGDDCSPQLLVGCCCHYSAPVGSCGFSRSWSAKRVRSTRSAL